MVAAWFDSVIHAILVSLLVVMTIGGTVAAALWLTPTQDNRGFVVGVIGLSSAMFSWLLYLAGPVRP